MKINILFTRSNKILSKIIRKLTKEPSSHCAIEIVDLGIVIHSTVPKISIISINKFRKTYDIVNSIELDDIELKFGDNVNNYYDILALLYLGLRFIFKTILPKANLWNITGMSLCTEFVMESFGLDPDPMITPHKLYNLLVKGIADGQH